MGSKTDKCSGETCQEKVLSQYSVNDAKSSARDNGQHSASERSNLFSVNSIHDSFSENAETKVGSRTSDVSSASEDVEMLPKFRDPKNLDGHDDNISCISGANDVNKLANHLNGNVDRKNIPCSSASNSGLVLEGCGTTLPTDTGCLDINCDAKGSYSNSRRQSRYNDDLTLEVPPTVLSTELSSPVLDVMETPSSKGVDDGTSSPKVQRTYSHPPSDKSLSCNPCVKDLEEDSCSHLQGELPECSKEHLNPLFTKEAASGIVCRQKSASYKCCDISLVGVNFEASEKISLNLGTENNNGSGNLPAEALNIPKQIEEVEKIKESLVLPDAQETSLQSHPMDETDESDIVEHDVKVCDICGDAGREDLLAICSRCSDGAEHTYCMRDTLDKVPEGDWLCEECKFEEEMKYQKQDRSDAVDGSGKNQSSGEASAVNTNLFMKLDTQNSDLEGNRISQDISSAKASGKRHAENIEVTSEAKRQATEPFMGSPKTSSPSRLAAISRDCSSNNLSKGKVKPVHQSSFGSSLVNETPEIARSHTTGPLLQTPRGILIKSNSFNSSNAKPKVKLVDEVVLQKQKSNTKEGSARLIGKSMSFKSANSGRLNASESKNKIMSPKFSHGQDLRGFKQGKERNLFERKNSFRSESLPVNLAMASSTVSTVKVDKTLASCGETHSLSFVNNNHERKPAQSDSKLTRPVARGGPEMPVPLGEIKRQSSCLTNGGVSLTNGTSNIVEHKPNQTSHKDNPLPSTSLTAERSFCNVNESAAASESLPEGLPQSKESTSSSDKIIENSRNRSKQNITAGGKSVPCQKCKEVGHAAQFCTVDSPRPLAVDAFAARSSREVMNGGNKLKAAIQAAIDKKPGIYRKNKDPDQSDELPRSSVNLNCEVPSRDQFSISCNMMNKSSLDEIYEGQAIPQNSSTDSCKHTTVNNVKQLSTLPINSKTEYASDRKSSITDLSCHTSAALSVLSKMSAIPEHEYIWLGGFEVHKSGNLLELCDGIQAHLSTCASPKVLEVVKKLPSKVLLNEVPRLSTWPILFQEKGVKEDNIGLYFFAKDMGSYEKSYKRLLESMMKNDLALKGNLDGVELLIFPSNVLPENFQRWNMLFFLWGVFRGKRNCSQHVTGSLKEFCFPRENPNPIISLADNISLGDADKDLPVHDRFFNVALATEAPVSRKLPCLSSETDGDCVIKVSSLDPKGQCVQTNLLQQDCRLNSSCLSRTQTSSELSWPGMRCTSTTLEEDFDRNCKLDTELQPSVQFARTFNGCRDSAKKLMHLDAPLDRRRILSHSFEKHQVGSQEVGATVGISVEKKVPDRVNVSNDQVKFEENLKEEHGSIDTEAAMRREESVIDLTMMELDNWQYNHMDTPETLLLASSASTCQTTPWNDINGMLVPGTANKKQKTGFNGLNVSYSSGETASSRDGFAPRICDAGTSSPIRGERLDEGCNETLFLENSGNAERYFFPVDTHSLKDSPGNWKVSSSKDEDPRYGVPPNLELALWAEMNPSKQEILPFLDSKVDKKNAQDQPLENLATRQDGDNASASLSLSLSFPFPDTEQTVKPVSETEKLQPEKQHVNTSLLLFGGFSDK
ncbi:protein PARALOG OF AIPP2-like [Cornus florida]|uniref:protein PARALOG OF AIPP2-like n=1 Tax=Cornus florida TaxID=4283 RepID=UPI002899160B|nr:protein PARALOG OF AIPP2-like [Cornus florida]